MSPPAMPPVFKQLFDFGNLMQELAQNKDTDTHIKRQLEDLVHLLSSTPFMFEVPTAASFIDNPWANLFSANAMMPTGQLSMSKVPALGLTREYQEEWMEFHHLQQVYSTALANFNQLFREFGRRASEVFLSLITKTEQTLDFHTLCHQWVDCCENEFQEIAQTAEFAKRLGELMNAQLQLARHSNRLQDRWSELQGQPTRGELDELRQHNSVTQAKLDGLEKRLLELEKSHASSRRKRPPKQRKSTV